ncbi:MAG: alpha/beta hydrolase, partial [Spirochaeta sp.]|nr:alpha/beta hydrolase [Spirochaeta sp.]
MESSFLFVRFSRLLMANNLASVRFDFLDSGESDGDFEKMTLSSEIEDGFDILDYFSALPEIDRRRIFL